MPNSPIFHDATMLYEWALVVVRRLGLRLQQGAPVTAPPQTLNPFHYYKEHLLSHVGDLTVFIVAQDSISFENHNIIEVNYPMYQYFGSHRYCRDEIMAMALWRKLMQDNP
jgi:hypothetical protein